MVRGEKKMLSAADAAAIIARVNRENPSPAAASAKPEVASEKKPKPKQKSKSKNKGPADKGDSVMSTPTSKAGAPIIAVALDLSPEDSKPPAKPSTPAGLSHRRHFYDVEDYASSFSMMIAEKFNFDTTQSEALERELQFFLPALGWESEDIVAGIAGQPIPPP